MFFENLNELHQKIGDKDYNLIIFKSKDYPCINLSKEKIKIYEETTSTKMDFNKGFYKSITLPDEKKINLFLYNQDEYIINHLKNNKFKVDIIGYDISLYDAQEIDESKKLIKKIKKEYPSKKQIASFSKIIYQRKDGLRLKGLFDSKFKIGQYYLEYIAFRYSQQDHKFGSEGMENEYQNFHKFKEELINLGIDSFIEGFDRELYDLKQVLPTIDYLCKKSKSKLYILLAPTGFGKSTLIKQLNYLGVREMTKLTTRPYRSLKETKSKNIESITINEFQKGIKEMEILGGHSYNNNAYGIKRKDFEKIQHTNRDYIYDSCDFKSAYSLKKRFPEKISLITVFPSFSFAGYGLKERINKLKSPYKIFSDYIEELEYLKNTEKVILDTKKRLDYVAEEAQNFKQYLNYFDLILGETDLLKNITNFLKASRPL